MLKVTHATKQQIRKFNLREWHGVDVEHYGKPVEWNEREFLYKATLDGEIVGTTGGKYESGVVYLGTIIVAAHIRGKGVGRALMDKVEAFARKNGAHKIHLTTGRDWEANAFYLALGFEKVADLPDHHFHRDFVIYSKRIG